MSKTEFVRLYAIQFCAARMAKEYDDFCQRGWTDERGTPPVEDAINLAEFAWDKFTELGGNYFPVLEKEA